MAAESDLQTLIRSMRPRLHPHTYVFASVPTHAAALDLNPLMRFEEAEGVTLIMTEEEARATVLQTAFPCRMITLSVHSDLSAVGFLASVTARLAGAGVAVNAVSAFHHDHLFVPVDRAEEALRVLGEMAEAVPTADRASLSGKIPLD
jgi:hypothetical protein